MNTMTYLNFSITRSTLTKNPPSSSSLAVDVHSIGRQNKCARSAYEMCQEIPEKKSTVTYKISKYS